MRTGSSTLRKFVSGGIFLSQFNPVLPVSLPDFKQKGKAFVSLFYETLVMVQSN